MEIVWELHFKVTNLRSFNVKHKMSFNKKKSQNENSPTSTESCSNEICDYSWKHSFIFEKQINFFHFEFISNFSHFNCKLSEHLICFSSVWNFSFSFELCININKCFCFKLFVCLIIWNLFDCRLDSKIKIEKIEIVFWKMRIEKNDEKAKYFWSKYIHQKRCPSATILIFPPRFFFSLFLSFTKSLFVRCVYRLLENRLLKKFVLMAILWRSSVFTVNIALSMTMDEWTKNQLIG